MDTKYAYIPLLIDLIVVHEYEHMTIRKPIILFESIYLIR